VLAVAGAVLVGVLTVLQARVNGQLAAELDDAYAASVISFGSGLVIVVALAVAVPPGRAGLRALRTGIRGGDVRWWMLIGGTAGALNVLTQSLTVAIVGASMFTVGIVAGQTVSGLLMDRVGYSPSGVTAVTLPRVAGAGLTIAAVVIALGGGTTARLQVWMIALPFLAGVALAWQQATNGRLRVAIGSPLVATVVNFVAGTIVLAVAAIVHLAIAGPPDPAPLDPLLYAGGALGVVYIMLSAAITPRTGVLLFGLGSVLGLLLGSVVLDVVWPVAAPAPAWQTALTVGCAVAGVVVASLRRR